MAKLSTPYHECAVTYIDSNGQPTGSHCPNAAYRKHGDKWLCKKHMHQAKQREAQRAEMFTVIGNA